MGSVRKGNNERECVKPEVTRNKSDTTKRNIFLPGPSNQIVNMFYSKVDGKNIL